MPGSTIQGDIRDKKIFDELLEKAQEARKANPNVPLFVVGGPPCQGFSTAGNRRTMTDERNWLFVQYKAFLQKLKPDGFVFENVSGLLSMEKGKIFELISSELRKCTKQLHCWILKTEEFAIPQRRTRVLLIGDSTGVMSGREPKKLTRLESDQRTLFDDLASAITVAEALSDLPKLKAGEDGCHLPYLTEPQNIYQKLMRGMITPEQYLVDVVRRLSRMAA
jgi:DNA (cytosine-5)-methyltransferase 1